MLADQITARAARGGDHAVPVCHDDRCTGGFAQRFAQLRGKLVYPAQQGVLLENHLAVLARVNLKRVTVADNIDTENLVLVVFIGLNQRFFDIFRAEIKIYGFLQTAAA